MKYDIFKYADQIPNDFVKRRLIDGILNFAIPFNLSLGMKIQKLDQDKVIIKSTNGWKTKNHVGGAHACFLALMGEYPAGLLLAQIYSPEKYRMIIKELQVDYKKQGKGSLKSVARKPFEQPQFEDGEAFIPMTTDIFNENGDLVAVAKTLWQMKEWAMVGKHKEAASN